MKILINKRRSGRRLFFVIFGEREEFEWDFIYVILSVLGRNIPDYDRIYSRRCN